MLLTLPQEKRSPIPMVNAAKMPRKEWLEYRRKGIGGSDVSAIMGISGFKTARDLYMEKIGAVPVEEDESKDEESWIKKAYGNALEGLVGEVFEAETGLRVFRKPFLYAHSKYPFMFANVDFFVVLPDGTTGLLECKTGSIYAGELWKDAEGNPIIPAYYEAQVRHYMAVMDIDVAYIALLYGNSKGQFLYRKIERDREYEQKLIELESNFWHEHVLKQIPPAYTEKPDLVLQSIQMYRKPVDKMIELDVSLLTPLKSYLKIQDQRKGTDGSSRKLKAEMDAYTAPIIEAMGDCTTAELKENGITYEISYKASEKESIPKAAADKLKIAHPEIYEQYVSRSTSYAFKVKKIEEEINMPEVA